MVTPTQRVWHCNYLYQCIDNTVPDTISRLDYNLALNCHADDKDGSKEKQWSNFLMLNKVKRIATIVITTAKYSLIIKWMTESFH